MTTEDQAQEPFRGKVAAIVSNRAVAINLGHDDGVRVGVRFAILYPDSSGVEVKDPDTGATLGPLELPKTVVKVFRVSGPHLCVARTYRKIPGTPGKMSPIAIMLEQSSRSFGTGDSGTPDQHETLEIDDADRIDQHLDPDNSFVEIGDPVVQAIGDEFDGYSDFR